MHLRENGEIFHFFTRLFCFIDMYTKLPLFSWQFPSHPLTHHTHLMLIITIILVWSLNIYAYFIWSLSFQGFSSLNV